MNEPILKLREVMREEDGQAVLARIIKFSNPRTNAESVAEKLIDNFGSLKGVLEARPEQIMNLCSKKTAELLQMLIPVFVKWKTDTENMDRIGNSREAEKYCMSLVAGLRNEEFWVVCLNAKCNVIGKRCISSGSLSEVSAYPRMVMETALNYNAHSILLTHNHPGGTCAPSPEDIASTVQLQRLMDGVGIIVLDHIIVANDNTYSMIQHGDIDYRRGHK